MTDSTTSLLGIDWGSSNRRTYVLDGHGTLLRQHDDNAGILHVDGDFQGSLRLLLRELDIDRADIVMSGMIGSRNGWREVPYLPAEHPLEALAWAMVEVDTGLPGVRARIVPGYQFTAASGLPDVMRGEEAQVFGAMQRSANDGCFLLPGTHSKWVRVAGGKIVDLATFMTGEFFSLLTQHGTLAKAMKGTELVPDAFTQGVDAARHGGFTHMAFCARALIVTDRMPPTHGASFLSGLLIGSELHEILRMNNASLPSELQVIGSAGLAPRYLNALELLGIRARAWKPDDVYMAALRALFNLGT
jgi:2-dehydro-3-deoxygalactonokinase